MKTIDEIQTEFVTAFNEIDDWMMQYEFLLQVGAELEPYPDKWRDDTHLIQGCQSKVWIHCEEGLRPRLTVCATGRRSFRCLSDQGLRPLAMCLARRPSSFRCLSDQ